MGDHYRQVRKVISIDFSSGEIVNSVDIHITSNQAEWCRRGMLDIGVTPMWLWCPLSTAQPSAFARFVLEFGGTATRSAMLTVILLSSYTCDIHAWPGYLVLQVFLQEKHRCQKG